MAKIKKNLKQTGNRMYQDKNWQQRDGRINAALKALGKISAEIACAAVFKHTQAR